MTKYYGVSVSEITGNVDKHESDDDYKPSIEPIGTFSFVAWFKSEYDRDLRYRYYKDIIVDYRGTNVKKNI